MRTAATVALLSVLLLLGGCAAYRAGQPAESLGGSIYIAPVANLTLTPQVRALLTEQLRRTFADSGQWQLASRERAAHQLEVLIVEASQAVAATRADDTARGLSFESEIVAEITLQMPDGSVRAFSPVQAFGLLFDTPGQPEVAYQALPSVTQKLAEQIYHRVTWEDRSVLPAPAL
ncbi:MAG: LPS assembly lipoprotein LptE [Verrucomicrobiota bacterium]